MSCSACAQGLATFTKGLGWHDALTLTADMAMPLRVPAPAVPPATSMALESSPSVWPALPTPGTRSAAIPDAVGIQRTSIGCEQAANGVAHEPVDARGCGAALRPIKPSGICLKRGSVCSLRSAAADGSGQRVRSSKTRCEGRHQPATHVTWLAQCLRRRDLIGAMPPIMPRASGSAWLKAGARAGRVRPAMRRVPAVT